MSTFIFIDDMLLNILLVNEKPSGGAAVQSLSWIKGLISKGHTVKAMTSINNNFNLKDIKKEYQDIKLIPLFDYGKGIRILRWIYYRFPYIYNILRKNDPDYLVL